MNPPNQTVPRLSLRVASVYGPSPDNRQWLQLQDRFVQQNCAGIDVDFGIFLNGTQLETEGTTTHVLGHSTDNLGHARGLERVLAHFRAASSRADGYLLLDSDCFPVHPHWMQALRHLMDRHAKRFAAPVRFENLEPYPHPCALYIDGAMLDDPRLRFDESAVASNLLGEKVRDIGAGLRNLEEDLLPLVRTNTRNLHPIAAAVYNHLFYHHGAGSRGVTFRATHKYGYYAHWRDEGSPAEADAIRQQLFCDPDGFIRGLLEPIRPIEGQ